MQANPVKIVRVHISCADRCGGKPLYEAILDRCRELGIAGATVLAGLEGYGETARIHKPHLTGSEEPVVVLIVDSAENIARLTPALENMVHTGVIAVSDARAVRVERASPSASPRA
jgi:PII-like signaling protein